MIVPNEYKRSWDYPGYYFHLQNDGSFISMGIYMPEAPVLKQLRYAIDEDFEVFSEIVKRLENDFGGLSREEDSLKRVPTGFAKDSPAAEYLKLKNIYVYKEFSNKEVMGKGFLEKITALYHRSFELKQWLAEAMKPLI